MGKDISRNIRDEFSTLFKQQATIFWTNKNENEKLKVKSEN